MHEIALRRLVNQRLISTDLQTPVDVVRWLGAVQAQEYLLAKWALGLRLPQSTDDAVQQAFDAGHILRTHVMRPTWHFVAPEDIRWLLKLTAPRVHVFNRHMYRKLELDGTLLGRSNDAIARALEGCNYRTRTELAGVLHQAGIEAEGVRLAHVVMVAELEGLICSGPRRGKQFTYALLDERAPNARHLARDESLAELTRRFFTSHGPATIEDFAWWSGLTKAEVRDGLDMVQSAIVAEVIDDKTYWSASDATANTSTMDAVPRAFALPPFDEYGIAYKVTTGILDPAHEEPAKVLLYGGMLVVGGMIVGYWHRTLTRREVRIRTTPFRSLSRAEEAAFAAAVGRFGDFMGLPVALEPA